MELQEDGSVLRFVELPDGSLLDSSKKFTVDEYNQGVDVLAGAAATRFEAAYQEAVALCDQVSG